MACIVSGCTRPSGPESDECIEHLLAWEDETGREGATNAPCNLGHYACAHHQNGPCHRESNVCPSNHPYCEQEAKR